ncbi:hypothetical protein A6R68_02004, partial [Neotoma lepida]
TILKIITCIKNNQFQVLLRHADLRPLTQHIDLSLEDQDTYKACCTLHIYFSKLTSLNVKYHVKSRHYIHPSLPSGDS